MSRRKTLLANELPNFEDDVVDDEAEKRRRVSERFEANAMRIARKGPADGSATVNKSLSGPAAAVQQQGPKPTNEQLSCLYNNCVKLLNENKINAKNAFQLKLIDYMTDIVLNKDIVGGVTNFQVVGCTIDAGTKIYAARVDALHQNTYQMLSGLGHGAADDEANADGAEMNGGGGRDADGNDDGMDVSGDEDDQANKKAKRVKRRIKRSNQIAENLDTITGKSREEFIDEDLYFGKISTCIEHEGISGILLNKIHIRDDSIAMLINADEKSVSSFLAKANEDHFANSSAEVNFKDIVDMCKPKASEMRNMKLCADLNSFKFIGWNADSNDEISRLMESMSQVGDDLEVHRFDANNLHMSHLNLTAQGVDVDIDDGPNDFHDPDVDNFDAVDRNELMHSIATSNQSGMQIFDKIDDIRALTSVAELTTLVAHQPSDYSYFNFDKLRMHDLPRHLKVIASRLVEQMKDGGGGGVGAGGDEANNDKPLTARNANVRKKEAPRVDLSIQTDRMKFFRVTKKAICLCDKTIEKRSEKPSRMETERSCDYNGRELFQPYWKPVPAKIFSDIEPVENLLGNDEITNKHGAARPTEQALDDDDHMGGIDDDFEIPCTAATNEPFFSQNGGEFVLQTQTGEANGGLGNLSMGEHHLGLMDGGDLGMAPAAQFDGDNLVQAPLTVNALNIEYAKTSKNIDVRRLKQVMWSLISASNDKENIAADLNGSDTSLNASKRLSAAGAPLNINVSLKSLYKQLRPPLISPRVYDDLSICIVFQMLLFLANEHGLLLKNDMIGSDVIITNAI